MKSLLKNTAMFLFSLLLIGIFNSCENNTDKENLNVEDSQLIAEIQNALNKTSVDVSNLPAATADVLAEDYSDSYTESAMMAPSLGYEVNMRVEKGSLAGTPSAAYFDMSGRELNSENTEKPKGKRPPKGDKGIENDKHFTVVLPISFLMPDGSTITIEEEEDWAEIKAWHEANKGSNERPEIQFPITVTLEDGTDKVINSDEEMKALRDQYREEHGKGNREKPFTFVLPASFEMPDGTVITVEDEAGYSAIKDWHEANPDVKERAKVQFPVDVKLKDGTVQTINNEEEFEALKEQYKKKKPFEFVLPASFEMPDGTVITVEDEAGYSAIKDWHESNPDVKERAKVQFPVDVKLEDGTTQTLNNEEELNSLKDKFKKDGKGKRGKPFTFVLPASFEMPDGTVITVEDEAGYSAIKDWHESNPDVKERAKVQFPVDVKLKDGTTKTLNNEEELKALEESLRKDDNKGGNKGGR